MPFAAAKFTDMFFEFSLMAEEGTLPPNVAARIQEKLIEKFELAETLQMHIDAPDYWDNSLRYAPFFLQCAALAPCFGCLF
jgi:hypothetical protein